MEQKEITYQLERPSSASSSTSSSSSSSSTPLTPSHAPPGTECRNCHEAGGYLIAPCDCSGSVKWVHRSCLDDWRAYSTNPRSFTHCDVCQYEYQFRIRDDVKQGRMIKFALRVCRDFFGAMLVMQAIIWLFTLICWACDGSNTLRGLFPKTWSDVGVYYIWGLFVFSMLAAMYGAMYLLYRCTCGANYSGPVYTYYSYPYGFGPYYMWWYYPTGYSCAPMCHGNCNSSCGGSGCGGGNCGSGHCGNCGGGGGGGNNDGIAILGIIIMVLAITIGIIVMVVIGTIILRRHAHILQKRANAREQEVVDRATESSAFV